jgi:hypothetical protein
MSNFQSYKKITDRLKSLGEKLAEEKLSAVELDEFENLARQLYERVLILNYKAKEVRVHGDDNQSESEKNEKAIAEKKKSGFNAVKEEKAAVVEETDSSDPSEIQFDFTSSDEESDEVDTIPNKEEEVKEEKEVENSGTQAEQEQKNEESKIDSEEGSSVSVNDSANQSFENEKVRSFYEQFEKVHKDSLGDRLGASKLDSLKGAIGLNDRLQFIAELFNGDSDGFNKAINALDEQPSNESARKVLSQVAANHSWEEENPLVEEFARIIERRYVEE